MQGVVLLMKLDSEWIFCPFVPIICGFLVAKKKKQIMALPWKGTAWALVPLFLSIALYWIGYKADTRYAGFASAQIFCAALLLWFGGWPLFKLLLFPWIFLVFTWPMLPLEELLAFPLRQVTTDASARFLGLIGVDNVKTGTAIISAADPAAGLEQGDKFSLDVEAPCSGIRSLFSLIMISAFYGYISLKGGARRFLLFFCAIPLAMLGNFVRILMLTFGSMYVSTEWAIGTNDHPSGFHIFSGFCVFAVALVGMFGIARILEKMPFGSGGDDLYPEVERASEKSLFNSSVIKSSALIVISLLTVGACYATKVSNRLSDPGLTMSLPESMGEFRGKDIGMSSQEKQAFDEGVEMARSVYMAPDGRQFMCTLVLSGPIKRSLHRPEVCLPGQGWKVDKSEVVTVTAPDGRTQDVTMLHLFRDYEDPNTGQRVRARSFDIYWYVGKDVATPSYTSHVILSHRDSVFRNINHRWGMASVFASLPPVPLGTVDPLAGIAAASMLQEFVGEMLPHIQVF